MGKRPGRPRKLDAVRYQNGKVADSEVRATPEALARRKYLVGDGDGSLSSYPLGILLANEAISQHQHDAGVMYAELYRSVFGKSRIRASDPTTDRIRTTFHVGRDPVEETVRLKEIDHLFRSIPKHKDLLNSVCVFEELPRFMRPVPPSAEDIVIGASLGEALTVVARYLKMVR